ncbi:MAG: hypothetical protein IKO66_00445 [Paludibacteraceae bacterium]|nr:hypothetical protein [Paludibacteraceae bacterium]
MSLKIKGGIVNIGTYHDNSREYNIDARGKDLASVIRAIETEDITPSEPSSSVSPESDSGNSLFCRITKAAYDKGVAQQVEDNLRSASVSAPKLVKTLNTNDALGYTDTKNLSSTDLYDLLNEHYGLSFKKHHFTVCRSKIATDFY